jgi:hypothetical protein
MHFESDDLHVMRAGLVVYPVGSTAISESFIIDDKYQMGHDKLQYAHNHNSHYYDSDTGESAGGSYYRDVTSTTATFTTPDLCATPTGLPDAMTRLAYLAASHYTFSATALITVDKRPYVIAPYLKPSSACAGNPLRMSFNLTDGNRNTGSKARISIHKISNLLPEPLENRCDAH